MATAKRSSHLNDKLKRFTGERISPLLPHEVAKQRPVFANKPFPQEFEKSRNIQSIYMYNDSKEKSDLIKTQSIEKTSFGNLSRVDMDTSKLYGDFGARLGQSTIKHKPEFIAKGISDKINFNSYRPEWMTLLHSPRISQDSRGARLNRCY